MLNKKMQKLGEERSVIREIFEYGNQRAKQIGRENVYDFSLGNPSVPAPDGVRQEIEHLLRELPSEKLHGYTSAAGAPEVRQAVSDYITATFGVPMRPELIYMTCGAAASLTVTFHALAEEGDEFIVLTPCFPEYNVFIKQAGGKVVPVCTDSNFHIDIPALAAAINEHTKAVLVNSPNNPTGAVYGEEELKALASLLTEKSKQYKKPIYIIADEPYRELTYGAKVPYIPALYPSTIVCYSFSKSLSLAGERIGYIAVAPACEGSEEIFSAVCGAGRSLGYVCAPALFQRVCAKLLGQSGDIHAYERNRDLLYNALTQAGFTCVLPQGAFYLFMQSPLENATAFCEMAKKHELLLVPSDSFGIKGYVRISTCVDYEMIKRSLPAFSALAKECGLK
ncbi:MAG: pyridoxal phosphate-dependent aminotransferase [Clostridia bacterium]|nr:pyridoxal phosphate-dependent aminotransferase [Clostridia bacterium]